MIGIGSKDTSPLDFKRECDDFKYARELRALHAVNTVLLRACLCDAVIQDLMPHR